MLSLESYRALAHEARRVIKRQDERLAAADTLRARLADLADSWQRVEEGSVDYQDALADAAEQLREALDTTKEDGDGPAE